MRESPDSFLYLLWTKNLLRTRNPEADAARLAISPS